MIKSILQDHYKGIKMIKAIILSLLVLASSSFGMSLSKLNSASKEELMQISGIGEKKAAAIIKERRKGKFKSFEDLQRVDGIGEQIASNVKHDVNAKKDEKRVTKKRASKKTSKSKKESKKSTKKTTPKTKRETKKSKAKKA
jgi:competence protein ComEA